MSVSDVLHPDGSDYDPFLFAEVGEDKRGATVTVVSALARLGLDPWTEARELALLCRDAAHTQLKSHLSKVDSVPALGNESGNVAARLIALLPERASRGIADPSASVTFDGRRIPTLWIIAALVGIVAIVRIIFLA